jgi:hypothetical protein
MDVDEEEERQDCRLLNTPISSDIAYRLITGSSYVGFQPPRISRSLSTGRGMAGRQSISLMMLARS